MDREARRQWLKGGHGNSVNHKSTALLVLESHRWRKKMTCRNFAVFAVAVWNARMVRVAIRQYPPGSLSSHVLYGRPGPGPNHQLFLDIAVDPNCSPWSQGPSSLNYPLSRGEVSFYGSPGCSPPRETSVGPFCRQHSIQGSP